MLRNYLKTAIRNLIQNKAYTAINIIGLAIGMAGCILITLWVVDEISYDRFHENASRTYRLIKDGTEVAGSELSALTSPPMAPYVKDNYPEVIAATRFGSWGRRVVRFEDRSFAEREYRNADSDLFRIFSFEFVKGDASTALADPYSVVLTEETATKYFGDEDPLGKSLTIDNSFDVTVSAVIRNMPANSTISFDLLSPFELLKEFLADDVFTNWDFNAFQTFVLLNDPGAADAVGAKMSDIYTIQSPGSRDKLVLQAFTDIHLNPNVKHDFSSVSDIKYVYIFAALAALVLLIACINFMNLATARSIRRAKEVGMRKVVGASRRNIVIQFFGEAFVLSAIAMLLAMLLVELYLPVFNILSGKQLAMNSFGTTNAILGLLAMIVVTGILAGSYPALVISTYQPAYILKGAIDSSPRGAWLRKVLVVTQFSLSVFLMIGVAVVSRQVQFLQQKDLGINKDHVLYIRMAGESNGQYAALKNELRNIPGIQSVTASFDSPENITSSPGCPEWDGKEADEDWDIRADFVDYDYFETFGIQLAAGRTFSREFAGDSTNAYIVNEEAVRMMRMENPVGQRFGFWDNDGTIIGVVKDFHFQPLRNKIEPIVFTMNPGWLRVLYLRIQSQDVSSTIGAVENVWNKFCAGYPFEYHFLDEEYETLYRAENRMSTVLSYFASLAIFLACLGLLGLVAFMTERRTKEIGVRKALGASVSSIVILLSREFMKWVLIANVIAWPIGYWVMRNWLESFAYRTSLGWESFVGATMLAVTIAWLTVAYQAMRAARAKPITALKYE